MSRGIDTIDAVLPTGSSEMTIIVSVSVAERLGVASTPTSRMLIRSPDPGTGPMASPPSPSVPPWNTRANALSAAEPTCHAYACGAITRSVTTTRPANPSRPGTAG